ncbi:juxtaposed with another zinc finger protein 1 [Bacillus rossius redtenbacheri]|uniref:juxtaposed with another zinc finger protein 1 n=1 Tax=Bacillus rossius redtenbacheri TaxID=93214 RepID=UPI002FDCCBF3
MAVFMINICKFNECGLTFPNLLELIQHIEGTHIDYDPRVIEQKELQQPSCLPLSYVLSFFSDEGIKRKVSHSNVTRSISYSAFSRSSSPTGSDGEEDEFGSELDNSNESWATSEEFSSEFILKYGSRLANSSANSNGTDKPFACPVPGCKKRYKNINGMKYHSKNGHKKDGKLHKAFKCHCGKSYKTRQGLKNHGAARHGTNLALAVPGGEAAGVRAVSIRSLDVKAMVLADSALGVLTPAPSPQVSPLPVKPHPPFTPTQSPVKHLAFSSPAVLTPGPPSPASSTS